MNDYSDILHLPHPTSKRRPRMPMIKRAAQFAPFAAVTGLADAVREANRITEPRIELDEYELMKLDRQLQCLRQKIHEHPQITACYFQPDERKDGGSYQTKTGALWKIDTYKRELILVDGMAIPIDNIIELSYGEKQDKEKLNSKE